jgi:hypothetical protein
MNAYSRTLPLPGVALPVREAGASALDRRAISWPAPHAGELVLDPWGPPTGAAAIRTGLAVWPAPDPVMRVELSGPVALRVVAPNPFDFIDPVHHVATPDVAAAARAARAARLAPVPELGSIDPVRPGLPAPTIADAAIYPAATATTVVKDRSGVARRLAVSLAVAAGAFAAVAAAAIAIY